MGKKTPIEYWEFESGLFFSFNAIFAVTYNKIKEDYINLTISLDFTQLSSC